MAAVAKKSSLSVDDGLVLNTRLITILNELIDSLAATTLGAGMSLDHLNSAVIASLMRQAEMDGMDVNEVAARLQRSPSWSYEKACTAQVSDFDSDSFFLDERIVDSVASEVDGKTISELAMQLKRHEKTLAPLCNGLVRNGYLIEIPHTAPRKYIVSETLPQITHSYPKTQQEVLRRRERAEMVVEHANELKCLTCTHRLSTCQSEAVYLLFRDYTRVPYLESVLNQLHADSKRRRNLPERSTFGAVLAFSPTDGGRGPISHYRQCYRNWQDRNFELLPYRYALDSAAVREFEDVHLAAIADNFSSLKGASSTDNAPCFQLSLVWGVL